MADDFTITQGTGTTIRAVEKSSKKTQVVTLDLGGAGVETLIAGAFPGTDLGPGQTLTRTRTTSADMTTPAIITPEPATGKKIVAMDIFVSNIGTAAVIFNVQMETSGNIVAPRMPIPMLGYVQLTLRGEIKGDVADKALFGKTDVASQVDVFAITYSES